MTHWSVQTASGWPNCRFPKARQTVLLLSMAQDTNQRRELRPRNRDTTPRDPTCCFKKRPPYGSSHNSSCKRSSSSLKSRRKAASTCAVEWSIITLSPLPLSSCRSKNPWPEKRKPKGQAKSQNQVVRAS